jgi:hypothetical protein
VSYVSFVSYFRAKKIGPEVPKNRGRISPARRLTLGSLVRRSFRAAAVRRGPKLGFIEDHLPPVFMTGGNISNILQELLVVPAQLLL